MCEKHSWALKLHPHHWLSSNVTFLLSLGILFVGNKYFVISLAVKSHWHFTQCLSFHTAFFQSCTWLCLLFHSRAIWTFLSVGAKIKLPNQLGILTGTYSFLVLFTVTFSTFVFLHAPFIAGLCVAQKGRQSQKIHVNVCTSVIQIDTLLAG